MDIGTAKPTPEENAPESRTPWWMSRTRMRVGAWRYTSMKLTGSLTISTPGVKLPFLVGGTGQYIRSIIEGWQIPPQKPDYHLRDALNHWAEEIGAEALYDRLKTIDTDAAANMDYRNVRRVVRALEVIFRTGERFSDLRRKQQCRYRPIILGIKRPREALYERVDKRIEMMLDAGFVDEVKSLPGSRVCP